MEASDCFADRPAAGSAASAAAGDVHGPWSGSGHSFGRLGPLGLDAEACPSGRFAELGPELFSQDLCSVWSSGSDQVRFDSVAQVSSSGSGPVQSCSVAQDGFRLVRCETVSPVWSGSGPVRSCSDAQGEFRLVRCETVSPVELGSDQVRSCSVAQDEFRLVLCESVSPVWLESRSELDPFWSALFESGTPDESDALPAARFWSGRKVSARKESGSARSESVSPFSSVSPLLAPIGSGRKESAQSESARSELVSLPAARIASGKKVSVSLHVARTGSVFLLLARNGWARIGWARIG